MSSVTSFREMDMYGVNFRTRGDIESAIEKSQRQLADLKKTISMYCVANPKDVLPKDKDWDAVEYMQDKLDQIFEDMFDSYDTLIKAYIADLNFDELVHWEDDWDTGICKVFKGDEKEPFEYIYKSVHYTPAEYVEKDVEGMAARDAEEGEKAWEKMKKEWKEKHQKEQKENDETAEK